MDPQSLTAIFLTIVYWMPGQMPNKTLRVPEPTMAQCLQDAATFLERGVPDSEGEAIGSAAICFQPRIPSTPT
jgi:hypothetical protein